jgi:hypothetical protein
MFCPQCKAEYRQGITGCADCQVPLVPSLPEAPESHLDTISAGPLVPLWEGEDLALHTSLIEALDEAGIRYFSKPLGIFAGARRWDPYPIQPMTHFGYQVAVLSSNLAQAEEIVETLLDEKPQDMELPEQADVVETASQPAASTEEKPTCEIWAGVDERIAQFLTAALKENEITIHLETAGDLTTIFVSATDEARAREIVREVVDATPPE